MGSEMCIRDRVVAVAIAVAAVAVAIAVAVAPVVPAVALPVAVVAAAVVAPPPQMVAGVACMVASTAPVRLIFVSLPTDPGVTDEPGASRGLPAEALMVPGSGGAGVGGNSGRKKAFLKACRQACATRGTGLGAPSKGR